MSAALALLLMVTGLAQPATGSPSHAPKRLICASDLAYLEGLTKAVVEEARVRPGQVVPGAPAPKNTTGVTLVQPGGKSWYPSYWVRDFAMSTDCGYITDQEMLDALHLTLKLQQGSEPRRLASGGVISAWAVPEHIRFDGRPVFYPATYSYGDDQGADPWGPRPPADDQFYTIHIAWRLWKNSRSARFLSDDVQGMKVMERLEKAFDSPITAPATGAVVSEPATRCVGFGFQDSVYLTGSMCFATLLRWQAAGEMAAMVDATHLGFRPASWYRDEAKKIGKHLVPLFGAEKNGGWLQAATGIGRQPDVWATLFALHIGALPRQAAKRALNAAAVAVRKGTIEFEGAVRSVPSDRDARPDSAWERSVAPVGYYQNGAYWHTATGWLLSALWKIDKPLAQQVLARYLQHLRRRDYRNGGDAPLECFGKDGKGEQNPCYMTSVALPLSVLRSINR